MIISGSLVRFNEFSVTLAECKYNTHKVLKLMLMFLVLFAWGVFVSIKMYLKLAQP